jgi:hypothetical protein
VTNLLAANTISRIGRVAGHRRRTMSTARTATPDRPVMTGSSSSERRCRRACDCLVIRNGYRGLAVSVTLDDVVRLTPAAKQDGQQT